jgi:hypothetical protein
MSGEKWMTRRGIRRPLALCEPAAAPFRLFLDERALRRWLTQDGPESDPGRPLAGPERSLSQARAQPAQAPDSGALAKG